MSINIGFALDIAILFLLAATVFYAARLSYFMSSFREGRSDMHRLIQDLSAQVNNAQNAIAGMRNVAEKSGAQLQEIINESKFLSDELRFMNESGDNLADRLEKLAERNRELIDLFEGAGGIGVNTPTSRPRPAPVPPPSFLMRDDDEKPASSGFGFSIRDKDFDSGLPAMDETLEDDLVFAHEQDFSSQAERDLYEALKRGRAKTAGKSR